MAGTLTISTLSDGTNSTSSTNCIQGSARAWVQFAGSTATIRGSYNVSSITRNATGWYTMNFTNALPNINYSLTGSHSSQSSNSSSFFAFCSYSGSVQVATPTTSSCQFVTWTGGGIADPTYVSATVFNV